MCVCVCVYLIVFYNKKALRQRYLVDASLPWKKHTIAPMSMVQTID